MEKKYYWNCGGGQEGTEKTWREAVEEINGRWSGLEADKSESYPGSRGEKETEVIPFFPAEMPTEDRYDAAICGDYPTIEIV